MRTHLDNLLAHGTDRYGPVTTPMLMSIIDVHSGESPREPLLLDGWVRSEERPGRRNPGGCDLWEDQPLLGVLFRLSDLSGDARYREAANAYIGSFFARARKPNGLLAWGSHLFYNAYTDQIDDDAHGNPHEILIHLGSGMPCGRSMRRRCGARSRESGRGTSSIRRRVSTIATTMRRRMRLCLLGRFLRACLRVPDPRRAVASARARR